jgi:hypothetical protein
MSLIIGLIKLGKDWLHMHFKSTLLFHATLAGTLIYLEWTELLLCSEFTMHGCWQGYEYWSCLNASNCDILWFHNLI